MSINKTAFLELSRDLFDRGSQMRFQAGGNSMFPFIRNGSVVVVEPLIGASAGIGSVLFYHRDGGLIIAHRLIKKYRENNSLFLITKGDSLNYPDPPVTADRIMGRIIHVEFQKRKLRLDTPLVRTFEFIIALFSRGRYWNQVRIIRNLGRLCWLLAGRRLK